MSINETGYSYFGLIDDVVLKYPFLVGLDDKRIEYELILQVVNDKPIMLNEGYLIMHPLCRKAIMERKGLLWQLIINGFVTVLTSGVPIHEVPENKLHVDSFCKLTKESYFPEFKKNLEEADNILNDRKLYCKWPKYDTGSGFGILVKELREKNKDKLKLFQWSENIADEFLHEFEERYNNNTKAAPRTFWENLALKYKDEKLKENQKYEKESFVNTMMRIGNELYHHNFGVMLSKELDVPIDVKTGCSEFFDFLHKEKEYSYDETSKDIRVPRLNIPRSILKVPPETLVAALVSADVSNSRKEWLEEKLKHNEKSDEYEKLKTCAIEYMEKLAKELGGKYLKLSVKDKILRIVALGVVKSGVSSVIGFTVASLYGGDIGTVVGGISFITSLFANEPITPLADSMIIEKFKVNHFVREATGSFDERKVENLLRYQQVFTQTINKDVAKNLAYKEFTP